MSEEKARFSPISFLLMLVAVLAITAGLNGSVDFNIATNGVYFASSLGVLLMVYRIELQHSLSELIDSKFGSLPGMESEYKSTRSIINISLVLSFVLLFLTSIYALSRQFTLLYAICLRRVPECLGCSSAEHTTAFPPVVRTHGVLNPQIKNMQSSANYASGWRVGNRQHFPCT